LWACVALVLAATGLVPAAATELRWAGRSFQTVVKDKRLADFLRELAASQGTTAVIDPKVEGEISARFAIDGRNASAARKVLDDICANYGLTWYFDGTLLFIEPASEARNEVIASGAASAERIQTALQHAGVGDRRFQLQLSDGQVFVSGPTRYVEAVRQVVRGVDARSGVRDRSEVRIFELRYAWANDFEIRRASGRTVVPGVVSVLRGLFDGRRGSARSSAPAAGPALAMPRVTGNRSVQLPSGATAIAPRLELPGGSQEADTSSTAATPSELPQFHADARMNAVLVRDSPERMAEYARLIEGMDRRPRLIEIEVTIMDIGNDSLDRLGVDWRAHSSRLDIQTGNGGVPPLTWNSAATVGGQTGAAAPLGGVFTAAIGHELRNFLLARVSALVTQGQASFIARPKLLTLDNTEASIENKSEFFVRVPGFQDSSLYAVIAGTDVRLTPLVIDDGKSRGVLLNINIGDDSLSADQVDNLPIVRRRSVATQALVDDGKSVLLAGYSSEEQLSGVAGVPVLSSIPVVGQLFRHQEKKRVNVERLYLLTPRLVTIESAAAAELPAAAASPAGAASAPPVAEGVKP
jgi:type III secretion protein C